MMLATGLQAQVNTSDEWPRKTVTLVGSTTLESEHTQTFSGLVSSTLER